MLNNHFSLKTFGLGLLLAAGFSACSLVGIERSRGPVTTATFEETGFHSIHNELPGDIEIKVGDSFKVEVTAEESALEEIETFVTEGVLHLQFDNSMYDVDHLKVIVTAPAWSAFTLTGSANMTITDAIVGSSLSLKISGSGDVFVNNAQYTSTQMDISGSGNMTLAGASDSLVCKISGIGSVNNLGYQTKVTDADISGSGSMSVWVTERLDVKISGSGDVSYQGNPATVNTTITGSGKVIKL